MEKKVLFFFSLCKSPGGDVITAETSGVLEMQNVTSAITYSSPDGLTSDSLPPPPASQRYKEDYASHVLSQKAWQLISTKTAVL